MGYFKNKKLELQKKEQELIQTQKLYNTEMEKLEKMFDKLEHEFYEDKISGRMYISTIGTSISYGDAGKHGIPKKMHKIKGIKKVPKLGENYRDLNFVVNMTVYIKELVEKINSDLAEFESPIFCVNIPKLGSYYVNCAKVNLVANDMGVNELVEATLTLENVHHIGWGCSFEIDS